MKKFLTLLCVVSIAALLVLPTIGFAEYNLSEMSDEELAQLRNAVIEEIVSRESPASEPSIPAEGTTLRDLFPCIDLAKAVRNELGLTSIDQPIPEGKLSQSININYSIYSDAKAVNIDSMEGIQYLEGLGSFQMDYSMYPRYEQVTSLPEGFYDLKKVWQVSLGSSGITEIDSRLFDMTSIVRLYLNHMNITSVPENIGNLYQAKVICFAGSPISSLPESLKYLTALEELDLSDTMLTEFPAFICDLPNLVELDISGTAISSLPEEIGKMASLKKLNISNTKISQLPASIFQLNLTDFKADGTDIE